MLRKKPLGRVTIDLRQLVIVWRIGKPLEAFSMIALTAIVSRAESTMRRTRGPELTDQ